jgi:hypothetical protein
VYGGQVQAIDVSLLNHCRTGRISDRPGELPAQYRDATGADELIITTITHYADRMHSYRLLAEEWSRR